MDSVVRLDCEIYFYHQADFICIHAMKLSGSIPILLVHRTDIIDVLRFASTVVNMSTLLLWKTITHCNQLELTKKRISTNLPHQFTFFIVINMTIYWKK
jgi:hypothetical protein